MKYPIFFQQLLARVWFRWVGLAILVLGIYWAGAGFPTSFLNSGDDVEFGKGGYGGGGYVEDAMVAMAPQAEMMKSSILPMPPMDQGAGDLTRYDEVGARIIKTGSLSLDVKNTNETLAMISTLATNYGGFVQASNTWLNYDETLAGSITLRVASKDFETAMEAIKKLATVVRSESVSGQDVTEEYIDIESRLATLKAEEVQYLEILKKASTVEEILKVNDYLSNVRGEIESTQGRLQYLENKTAFSTIMVDMTEEASVVAPTRDWKPFLVVKQAINQLVVAAQGVVNGFIWVMIFGVPFVLVVGIGWWLVKRVRRKK